MRSPVNPGGVMLSDRDFLARLERRLPHPEATASVRMHWMREGARLMVRLIALDAVLKPQTDHSLYVEALGYVQTFGFRCKASNDEVISATRAEFQAARDYCSRFVEALRRDLWHRCRAQQPEAVVVGAAKQIAARWDVPITDQQLAPVLRNIAAAAKPYQKRGRRGGR